MPDMRVTRHRDRLPKYSHHKPSGQAVVYLREGARRRAFYLGAHGSPESYQAFNRVVGEWLARGRRFPPEAAPTRRRATSQADTGPTIRQLAAGYLEHARTHYRRADGSQTNTHGLMLRIAGRLDELYGDTPAAGFGPLAFQVVRDSWVADGLARKTVNSQANKLRQMFKWAAARQIVPEAVWRALQTVDGLRAGRTPARETPPITPADEQIIQAILPHLSRQVRALLQLQLHCGTRPHELLKLRACDIDMTGDVWSARLTQHKTAHHGRERVILIGPRGQEILRPFLPPARPIDAPLFSPREAEAERRGAGEGVGGEYYQVTSYCQAVRKACEKAFPPPAHLQRQRVQGQGRKARGRRWETYTEWRHRLGPKRWAELLAWNREHRFCPLQVRHTAATQIRSQAGLDAAQIVLGHASADVTQIYAEADLSKAREIIRRIG